VLNARPEMTGPECREARRGMRLKQKQLAKEAGLDPATRCRFERGKDDLSKPSKLALWAALLLASWR
jgi:transcriptional regulator with XRE-family HTH domain